MHFLLFVLIRVGCPSRGNGEERFRTSQLLSLVARSTLLLSFDCGSKLHVPAPLSLMPPLPRTNVGSNPFRSPRVHPCDPITGQSSLKDIPSNRHTKGGGRARRGLEPTPIPGPIPGPLPVHGWHPRTGRVKYRSEETEVRVTNERVVGPEVVLLVGRPRRARAVAGRLTPGLGAPLLAASRASSSSSCSSSSSAGRAAVLLTAVVFLGAAPAAVVATAAAATAAAAAASGGGLGGGSGRGSRNSVLLFVPTASVAAVSSFPRRRGGGLLAALPIGLVDRGSTSREKNGGRWAEGMYAM